MRLKRVIVIAAVCVVVASSVSAATLRIAVYVNGRQLRADAILHNGRTYLPARALAEVLGCSVQWDAANKAVYIQQGAAPGGSASTRPAAKQISQDLVYITNSGKEYHRATCRQVRNTKLAIPRTDAVARRYSPCTVCKP